MEGALRSAWGPDMAGQKGTPTNMVALLWLCAFGYEALFNPISFRTRTSDNTGSSQNLASSPTCLPNGPEDKN